MRKLAVALLAYVVVLGALALWRWHLWTFGADTGTFTQVVADAFGGFRDGPEQGTHFRFHWAPLLGALWPLVVLARSGLALQLAQIGLIAAAAVPLYAIARPYAGENRALAYASLALLYPPLGAVAFTEFHEIAFYPVLALALMWAAERARWTWFAIFGCAAALVREEACIVLACAGAVLAAIGVVRRNAPRVRGEGLLAGTPREPERLAVAGFALAILNLAALYVYYGIVIPRVGAWQPSRFYDYPFAQGPRQLIVALVSHPANAGTLFTLGRFTYLLEALVPLAFLPLLSRWSLLALPGLLVVLLSSDPIVWRMGIALCGALVPVAAAGRRSGVGSSSTARTRLSKCSGALHHFSRCIQSDARGALRASRLSARRRRESARARTCDRKRRHARRMVYANSVPDTRRDDILLARPRIMRVFADDYPGDYYEREIRPEIARELASGRMQIVATFGRVRTYRRTPNAGARAGACITVGDVRYRSLQESLK